MGAFDQVAKGNLISSVAYKGSLEWMKFLFELDPTLDVNKPIKIAKNLLSFEVVDNNLTPLMLSMYSNDRQKNFELFKYLVEQRKANVKATNNLNRNILHIAVIKKQPKIVQYIL